MSDKKTSLLIVDDDVELRKLLTQYLHSQGFAVSAVENASALDQHLMNNLPELIILDLMMPGEDGLSVVKRLHKQQLNIPIIMLSACGEEIDRIIGLEIGADDYMAKPFNPRELLARIRSILRRNNTKTSDSFKTNKGQFIFGPYLLDINNQTLKRNNETISLTCGEFSLLKIFVENPKRVFSRDNLLEKLKGYDCAPFDRSIDVRIMRLRQKIETDTTDPLYIKTVWGEGYRFIPG